MIEFKEGDVCYAYCHQYYIGEHYHPLVSRSNHGCDLSHAVAAKDFQLNEPCEGWYIPKSELDTGEKYNKAVEVFGLFGFELNKYHKGYSELIKVWRGVEVHRGELASTNATDGVKCTFSQLMAIGELKRKMDEPQFGKNKDGSMKLLKNNFSDVGDNKVDNKSESAFNRIKMAELEKCKVDFEIEKSIKRNKSKQAYDILKGLDYEYDSVKQQWYKKQYI